MTNINFNNEYTLYLVLERKASGMSAEELLSNVTSGVGMTSKEQEYNQVLSR